MKRLLGLLLAAFCGLAMANGKQPPPQPAPTPTQTPSANASATANSGSQANASGGTANVPNSWAVALPGHASPSYAGNYSICVRGRGILWNAFWSWEFDADCVRLIAELDRMARLPIPPAKVELLTSFPEAKPEVAAVACGQPAKAKTVQAAKAAGSCRS